MYNHRNRKDCTTCQSIIEQVGDSNYPCGVCEKRVIISDGGRSQAGFEGYTGDCVIRSIAIATGLDYGETYKELAELSKAYHEKKAKFARKTNRKVSHTKRIKKTARNGIHKDIYLPFLKKHGFEWVPTMLIGEGCKVHSQASELPTGRLILRLSRHLVAMIDGVIYDTYDSTRGGSRCVYGYFKKIM
jgi:hypothetical protein